MSERPKDCGLCGSEALRRLHEDVVVADEPPVSPPRFRTLWGCDRCRAYWSVLPPATGTPEYYRAKPREAHAALEGGRARFEQVRRAVERALGRSAYALLDVGCASGAHFDAYGPGVAKHGVEPAASAVEAIRGRGATWLGPSIDAIPDGRTFDAVTALDVLEHLERPRPFLDALDRRVAPGGVAALVTGDVDSWSARWGGRRWLYYALPEHCSFYSAASLRRYWEGERGYALVAREAIPNQDPGAAYHRAFFRAVAREAVLKLLPRAKVRALELAGRGRFPFWFDNMLLVFRKPAGPG